jgi:rhodanese-related sulfurtransferase
MPTKKISSDKSSPRKNPVPIWAYWVSAIVIVLLAAVVYFFGRSGFKLSPASTPTANINLPAAISIDDAYYLYQINSAYFLDVRPSAEWNQYHINNSITIPLDQLSARLSELPKNGVIVVVDTAGELSTQARDDLKKAGFPTVTVMTGGLDAWVQRGFPFTGTAPY